MEKDSGLLSAIIVNYNGGGLLANCVKSILESTYEEVEVVIIDNDSRDNSLEIIAEKFQGDARIKVYKNTQNVGFAEGANIGVNRSTGAILFILNFDVELERQCIQKLVNILLSDKKIGIVGPKVLDYHDRKLIQHVGASLDMYGFPRAVGEGEIDKGQFKKNIEVFYVPGLALMVKRSVVKENGLFDFKYFMFWEEIDLCWRTWLLNYSVVAVPSAVVYHVGGVTEAGGYLGRGKKYVTSANRRYLGERNNLRTILKNYSIRTLFVILPRYLALWLSELIFYLLTQNIKGALALLKALRWNILEFRDTWKFHVRVQHSRIVQDSVILRRLYREPFKVGAFRTIRTIIVR